MLLFAKTMFLNNGRLRGVSATVAKSIVIVVSPLNSLMSDQISRLRMSGIRASVIDVKTMGKGNIELDDHDGDEMQEAGNIEVEIDFRLCEERQLRNGSYHIVFAHPETLVSSKYGRELLQSVTYQENVVAIVIDEAHCIVEWSVFFRLFLLPITG